jgi:hypothetical protein
LTLNQNYANIYLSTKRNRQKTVNNIPPKEISMSEQEPSTNKAEIEEQENVSPYDGIDRATLEAIAQAKTSGEEQESSTPYADLRTSLRETLETAGQKGAFRKVYDMDNQSLDAFVEGAGAELKNRRVDELRSIIDAYDSNDSFGDRRAALREALEAAGDAKAFRTVFDMNNLDLTNFVNDARHQLEDETRMDESEAREHAYSEYEEREGTPYDVDKGRVKDLEEARNLANAEEVGRFMRDNPELAETAGIADQVREILRKLEEAAAAAKTKEADLPIVPENEGPDKKAGELPLVPENEQPVEELPVVPESVSPTDLPIVPESLPPVGLPAVPENVQPTAVLPAVPENEPRQTRFERVKGWLRRPYDRLGALISIKSMDAADYLKDMSHEDKEKRKKRNIIIIGAVAIVGAGIATYLATRGHHSGGGSASIIPPAKKTTGGGDILPVLPKGPSVTELPSSHGFEYPWNWAEAAGHNESWLHELGGKAAAAGHDVQWHSTGAGREWISVDGDSNTENVINILRTFAN